MSQASYGRVASTLHWLIGLALLGQIAFGFLLDDLAPRGTPARGSVINLHKSFGMILGVLIVARVAWRLRHPPPPWPPGMAAWQQRAARLGHQALYACMLAVPLAGYAASNFSRHGVNFFGLRMSPWGPDLPALYAALNTLHVGVAWLFCALIVGHVAASLKHALIDREAVFRRISPWAPSAPEGSS
jgi:cytochrome b561